MTKRSLNFPNLGQVLSGKRWGGGLQESVQVTGPRGHRQGLRRWLLQSSLVVRVTGIGDPRHSAAVLGNRRSGRGHSSGGGGRVAPGPLRAPLVLTAMVPPRLDGNVGAIPLVRRSPLQTRAQHGYRTQAPINPSRTPKFPQSGVGTLKTSYAIEP